MIDCRSCTAPTELFLCPPCQDELRAALISLAQGPYVTATGGKTRSGGAWRIERRTPGLLANLDDVINRQTRTGSRGGHRKRGDELPAPFEPDTASGKYTCQGRADVLRHEARNVLGTWIRHLCEVRGVEIL